MSTYILEATPGITIFQALNRTSLKLVRKESGGQTVYMKGGGRPIVLRDGGTRSGQRMYTKGYQGVHTIIETAQIAEPRIDL